MRKFVYADESGNFDFSRSRDATRYFILTSITMEDHSLSNRLAELRRELTWNGANIPNGFHATNDNRDVRNAVFNALQSGDFHIDATILDKPKVPPRLRQEISSFYRYVWAQHTKHIAAAMSDIFDELLVVAASIGNKKYRSAFQAAVQYAMSKDCPTSKLQCAVWSAASDTSLQIADYCSWAIQRKWEWGDHRPYTLIQDKIQSQYDLFQRRTRLYY